MGIERRNMMFEWKIQKLYKRLVQRKKTNIMKGALFTQRRTLQEKKAYMRGKYQNAVRIICKDADSIHTVLCSALW
jgi:hypothetical protein